MSTNVIIRWTLTMLKSSDISQITINSFSLKLGCLRKIRMLGMTTFAKMAAFVILVVLALKTWTSEAIRLPYKSFYSLTCPRFESKYNNNDKGSHFGLDPNNSRSKSRQNSRHKSQQKDLRKKVGQKVDKKLNIKVDKNLGNKVG